MTLVVVVQRNGLYVSLNQRYHFALIRWVVPMYGRS